MEGRICLVSCSGIPECKILINLMCLEIGFEGKRGGIWYVFGEEETDSSQGERVESLKI